MKLKLFFSSIFCIFLSSLVFAQSVTQIVLPNKVYIGDRAEVRLIFRSDMIMTPFDDSSSVSLDAEFFSFFASECAVENVVLEHTGVEYSLVISFVPWKTGEIDFPSFDLGSLISFSKKNDSAPVYYIDVQPIPVLSLAEKIGASSFCPPQPPLLMPGTIWFIAGIAVILLFLLSLAVYTFIRLPLAIQLFRAFTNHYSMSRNSKCALKYLRKLAKNSKKISDDANFCEQIQKILRNFMEKRFAFTMTVLSTSELEQAFSELYSLVNDETIKQLFDDFAGLFSRIDYIRFSCHENTVLSEEERENLIKTATTLVSGFDTAVIQ